MSGLLLFLRNIYVMGLFLLIEGVAIMCYLNNQGDSQSQILSYVSYFTGGIHSAWSGAVNFVSLSNENQELIERIIALEEELRYAREAAPAGVQADSITMHRLAEEGYNYIPARVISNSINKANNFITINAGFSSGVREEMALITPSGEMVGYITGCSDNYAVATSVLSRTFRSSGKLKGDDYFCSVWWSGDSRYTLNLNELSKYATLQVGDTVSTTGFSQIFPADITIGVISDFSLDEMGTSYDATIELAADISALNHVIVVGREEVLF